MTMTSPSLGAISPSGSCNPGQRASIPRLGVAFVDLPAMKADDKLPAGPEAARHIRARETGAAWRAASTVNIRWRIYRASRAGRIGGQDRAPAPATRNRKGSRVFIRPFSRVSFPGGFESPVGFGSGPWPRFWERAHAWTRAWEFLGSRFCARFFGRRCWRGRRGRCGGPASGFGVGLNQRLRRFFERRSRIAPAISFVSSTRP